MFFIELHRLDDDLGDDVGPAGKYRSMQHSRVGSGGNSQPNNTTPQSNIEVLGIPFGGATMRFLIGWLVLTSDSPRISDCLAWHGRKTTHSDQ